MAFRTPVDYGFAQVIDNSGLVNAYAQQQLQRNKEAQLQQKEVADQLAKINTNGIKEADIPHINEQFDKLRDIGNQARMAAGTSQALQKQAEFDKAAREMSYNIDQSKASNQLYQDRLKFYGAHNAKDFLDPDYVTRINAIKDIPTFSPDYQTVTNDIDRLSILKPKIDIGKSFADIVKDSYVKTKPTQQKVGDQYVVNQTTYADPSVIANKIKQKALTDDNYNEQLHGAYLDAYDQSDKKFDLADAKKRGFDNYNPNSFNDYVALQALRTAKPDQVSAGFKNVPREPQGRGGISSIESKPLPTEIDPNKDYLTANFSGVNTKKEDKTILGFKYGTKETQVPYTGQTKFAAFNFTPFTKDFNVDLGHTKIHDLSGGGANQTAKSGTRVFKSDGLVDVPYLVTEDGTRKHIDIKDYKKIKATIDNGTPIYDKSSKQTYVSMENVPSVVGSFMEPSNVKGEKGKVHYVSIDASTLPLNKNTKSDVATINQYQKGGGQIKGTKTTTKAITPDRNKVAKFTFDSK